ncbi:PKD-like family lipoprotein [Carboxylicivirga sp. RSCT41]|uniref:PKD-like family lipoprotein n=1 Tax=Carboxylicivirga agarovorans TaxID=3417570 RepID=UPI003D35666B
MKKIFQYIAILILVASACTEDKGTYDYSPLNEVLISGINDEYIALSEAPFTILPTVEQKLVDDESVLEYMWYAYNAGSQLYSADTLSFSKDLDLDSLKLDPKNYELVFRATDTSTGIYYDYRSQLYVKGFPDGLQVLSSREGNAQVSILRGTGEGLSDFEAFKLQNDNQVAGANPVSIIGINEFMRRGKPFRIALYCDDDKLGSYATGTKLEKTIDVTDAFQQIAAPTSIKGALGHPESFATGVFADDNKLYTTYQPGLFGDECSFMWSFDNVSPAFNSVIPYGGFVLFNPVTTGFCEVDSWGSRVSQYPPIDDEEAPFDRTNTGLSAVYGKRVSDYAMGVFKDEATNQRYLLAILNKEAAFKKEMNGADLENADIFDFLNSKQVLFYAFANKIYTYDVVANKVLYTYEMGSEINISHIEVSANDKQLFVGLGDGSDDVDSGSVYIMNIDLDGEILGIHEAYDHKFGKVVDFFENY